MLNSRELVLASDNAHKSLEFSRLFPGFRILLPAQAGVDFYYEETGHSFLENSMGKARHLFNQIHRPVIADDSGLCVSALNGEPGLHSARYGAIDGCNKLTPEQRIDYLLDRMAKYDNRESYFVCCMVLYREENRFFIAQETVHGELADRPSGSRGFGYDPIFYLPEYKKTIAELPDREKDKISHRGKAARRILNLINQVQDRVPG